MTRPDYFVVRHNADGSLRYYWRAPGRLAVALRHSPHRTTVRLPDEHEAAWEECRAVTARVKAFIAANPVSAAERPRAAPTVPRPAAAAPSKKRLHAAMRLAIPLLMQWTEEIRTPRLTQCVYVMTAENGWVKVGNAIKPMKRLERLSTANPLSLSLVFCLRLPEGFAPLVERRAHARLAPFRIRGEWFEVNPLFAVCAVLDEIAALVNDHDKHS